MTVKGERRGLRPLCGATSRTTGKPCRNYAGARTAHRNQGRCWLHGGATPSHNEAAARAEVNRQLAGLGLDLLPVPSVKSSLELARLVTNVVGDLNLTKDQRERLSTGRKLNLTDEQGRKLTERLETGMAIDG